MDMDYLYKDQVERVCIYVFFSVLSVCVTVRSFPALNNHQPTPIKLDLRIAI